MVGIALSSSSTGSSFTFFAFLCLLRCRLSSSFLKQKACQSAVKTAADIALHIILITKNSTAIHSPNYCTQDISTIFRRCCINSTLHCVELITWAIKGWNPITIILLDHIARTMYVDVVYCYRPSSVVCRLVCHNSEPCKNGWTNREAVWVVGSDWPKKSCIRWDAHWRYLANTIYRQHSAQRKAPVSKRRWTSHMPNFTPSVQRQGIGPPKLKILLKFY